MHGGPGNSMCTWLVTAEPRVALDMWVQSQERGLLLFLLLLLPLLCPSFLTFPAIHCS